MDHNIYDPFNDMNNNDNFDPNMLIKVNATTKVKTVEM